MTTNQEGKHASFRTIGDTSGTYNDDAIAAMLAEGASGGDFNGIMVSWLQIRLNSTETNLNNLMAAFAASLSFDRWDSINTLTPLPLSVSGLPLWLDTNNATSITADGSDKVSILADRSGSSNNGTQGTGSLQPTTGLNTINGRNVINFDVDALSIAADASIDNMFSGGATVFFVHESESAGAGNFGRLLEKASGPTYLLTDASGGAQTIRLLQGFSSADGDWATDDRVIVDNAPTISMLQYNSSSTSNDPTFETDGANSAFTEDQAPNGSSNDDSANPLIIGNRAAGDRGYDGNFGEILIYDNLLSAANISLIENYLSKKWGVTI